MSKRGWPKAPALPALIAIGALVAACSSGGGSTGPTATAVSTSTPAAPTATRTAIATAVPPTSTPVPTARGQIAFQSDRDGTFDIYLMNTEGTGITRLIEVQPGQNPSFRPRKDQPSFSADYTKVAFIANNSIEISNADGSGYRAVLSRPAFRGLGGLSWSPSGTEIAFYAYNFGEVPNEQVNLEVFILDIGTGQVRNISQSPLADLSPSWSPDGSRIAFASSRSRDTAIYTMALDGSNVVRIATGAAPKWSPDGTRIAYVLNDDIWTMNADGTRQTRLTVAAGRDISPDWSPDGSMIVFCSERDGNQEIYIMNADGSGQKRLTSEPGYDVEPAW